MVRELTDMVEDVVKCNKCGFCQEVCPTYKATGEEFSVARGRNRLIRLALDGKLDLAREPELTEHVYSCLLCGACVVVCPSSVITDQIMKAARIHLTKANGHPYVVRMALRGVLTQPKRLTLGAKVLRFYEASGFRWLARHTGLLNVLGGLGKIEGLLPKVPSRTLRERLPGILKKAPAASHRVAYYVGCVVNNFFADFGEASIKVLQENNCDVTVPETTCCGVPHEAYGDLETWKQVARENVEAMADLDVEAIVVDCSSCTHGLHKYAELFEDDPILGPKAKAISEKVMDISQYLSEIGYRVPSGEVRAKVTYHDPCHAVRGMGIKDAPRQIIKSIPGVEFVEMNEADWCCGGAGSYNITHYDLSSKVLDRKMGNYAKTGADYLATSCPACLIQLGHGIDRHGLRGKAIHVVELLSRAYEAEKKQKTSVAD